MTGLLVAPLGPPERLFGLGAVEDHGDRVHGSMRVADWMRTADGAGAAGVLGVLVDVVVGHAALFARPEGRWAVTTALSLEVVRPLPGAGAPLTVDGELVGADGGSALSTGTVRDGDGRPVALGSTWVRFTPGVPDFAEVRDRPFAGRPGALTVLDALGASPGHTDDGRRRLVVPPDPDLLNAAGVVHGGVVAVAAEALAAAAVADPDEPLVTAGLRASFLRPVLADGPVSCVATVEHRGRTTSLTTVEVHGSDGRRAVVASVTGRAG